MQASPPVTPGTYPGPGVASLLRANEQQLILAQQITPGGTATLAGANGSASIALQLERIKSSYYPFGVSFQVWFTNIATGAFATPGAFEIDIQTADIDADPYYVTLASGVLTAGLNANFVGRIELPPTAFWAKLVRAYVKTLANSATVQPNILASR